MILNRINDLYVGISFILFFIIISFNSFILANEGKDKLKGYGLIKNIYYSDEFKFQPQNWSIVQNSKGMIYFANSAGIFEHDGFSWNRINVPNNAVRSIAINKLGTIYIGGIGEVGYLVNDSLQSLKYFSLVNNIDPPQRNFSSVFQTYTNDNGVYFSTSNYLFRLYRDTIITFQPLEKFNRSFLIDNKIYIGEKGTGLNKVENDSLNLIKGGEFFHDIFVWVFLKISNGKFLIGTRERGFFIYDGFSVTPFPTEADNYIKENLLYYGTVLSDGNIAIATLQGGVIIINNNGKLINYYNEATGLQDNDVKYIFQDSQDNIWLALNNGITKIEYSSPFTVFDKRMGLDGIVLSVTKFQNNLYAGTTSGLYKLGPANLKDLNYQLNDFEKNDLINTNVWSLLTVNNELLAGSNNGIYLINSDKVKKISGSRAYVMRSYDKNNRLILLGTNEGLSVLYKKGNEWLEYNLYSKINTRISSLSGSSEDDIWIGTLSAGVLKINKSAKILENISNRKNITIEESFVTRYDTTYGLPSGQINIFHVSGHQVFATSKGVYKFNEQLQKFMPDSTFGAMFADGSRGVFMMVEDDKGNIWIHSNSENFLAELQRDGSYKIISKPFRRFNRNQVNAVYPDGDVVWFGSINSEIIKYDTRKKKNVVTDFNTLVRKVLLNGDSLIYGGAPLPADFETLSLNYNDRNLRFEYACPFYEEEERTEYQYKLDGYDKDWSAWKKETQKDYTNLQEGSYTFNVRAKNIYGDIGNIGSYEFKILPPFYRTIWAYIFYVIVTLLLIYIVIRWRLIKLEKEKEKLQEIVNERTKEVKKQNILLEDQTEKLKELDKIKSRFFANISHEFRTPLTLIIGPLQQLLSEEDTTEKKKKFSMILRNSTKLLSLINQLLDLSKLESGKMELRISKIEVVKYVKEIVSAFHSLAEQKKIKFKFVTGLDETELYCDKEKIEKVITNLLANAFKFTEEWGEISVSISKNIEDTAQFPEGNLQITISDTGIGINKEELKNVFDSFYRAEDVIGKQYQGTGIGLSLVKEFVELHKGEIKVNSEPKKGSDFIIKLPLGKSHIKSGEIYADDYNENEMTLDINYSAEEIENSEEENINANGLLSEDAPSVLIVDDNIDVRNYIKEYLRETYKIYEAENGRKALTIAKSVIPDLIISDVMMPEMDGVEFCEMLKTDVITSHIPVILLTAKAGDENIIHGLETGADDYITKPFNIQILLTRIKNLIELRHQLQSNYKRQLLLQPSEVKFTSLDDKFLKELQELIEENISNSEFNIESLCEKFYMSRTSLFRKIKALTGESPNQFLRSYRLKRAAQLLKSKSGNITQIAFEVGFNNSAYFTKCFKEQFNQLPSEFQAVEN